MNAESRGLRVAGRRTAVAERRAATADKTSDKREVNLQSLLQLGGTAALVLFLVLSLYYEKFYSRLGIEPSDVGLDRTAIVSRAVAGVIVLLGLVVVASLAFVLITLSGWALGWLGVWFVSRWHARLPQEHRKKLNSAWEQGLKQEWAGTPGLRWIERLDAWLTLVPISLAVPAAFGSVRYPRLSKLQFALRWTVFGSLGLLIALTAGWGRVNEAAAAAEEGRTVVPLTFAGIRVLDIRSQPCSVEWLGSANVRPAALNSSALRCLGTANGVAVFRDGRTTLTVPSSQIAITIK